MDVSSSRTDLAAYVAAILQQPHASRASTSTRPSTPGTPIPYYTTPAFPLKWQSQPLDEASVPLNLGVEKLAPEEEARWRGFRMPKPWSTSPSKGPSQWDCGICLESASEPCVTRCGHLFCANHLRHWLREHPSDPRCPACKARCAPESDVVPIFSSGAREKPKRAEPAPVETEAKLEPAPAPIPAHPLLKHVVVTRELGRLLFLLAFVALMTFFFI